MDAVDWTRTSFAAWLAHSQPTQGLEEARMARLRRLHVPGGIHYVILHSNEGREIFPEASDYESFSKLVERCVRRCRVQIYAFCWTAHEVHFAIQVSTVPLGR